MVGRFLPRCRELVRTAYAQRYVAEYAVRKPVIPPFEMREARSPVAEIAPLTVDRRRRDRRRRPRRDGSTLDAAHRRRTSASRDNVMYRHVAGKDTLIREMTVEVGAAVSYPIDRTRAQLARASSRGNRRRLGTVPAPVVVQAYTSTRYGFSIESLRCLDWLVGGFMDRLGVTTSRWPPGCRGACELCQRRRTRRAARRRLTPTTTVRAVSPTSSRAGSRPAAAPGRSRQTVPGPRTYRSRARIDRGIAWLCSGFAAG